MTWLVHKPFVIKEGIFVFNQDKMNFDNFVANYGQSDFKMNGYMQNVIDFALTDKAILKGVFTVQSAFLNCDEFMSATQATTENKIQKNDEKSIAKPAETGVVVIPSNFDFQLIAKANKVNFQDNIEPNIPTILRINNNYENNNIGTSNPLLKQNTIHNSKRNFSNNHIRENSPYMNRNNNYGNNNRNYNNDNSNKRYDNYNQNINSYNNNNRNSYDKNKNNNDKRNREKSPNRQNFQNRTQSKSTEKYDSSDNNNKRQKFTHDETIQNRRDIKCKNLAKGFCKYGNNCNFSHSK